MEDVYDPKSHTIQQQQEPSVWERETKRELRFLVIDCLSAIFLASCYLEWNIIL